ncbi:MAG TPA: 2-C-methyl-D-erythritol 4-phosphate cytidylyltransferase [Kiritimatiellia bacterium]|nr:2-C-methyl-D-erythritol 4-phosphate cytidylyltransferase [Kiritimatiellia bacterium]
MGTAWGVILAGGKDEEPLDSIVTGFLNADNRPVLSYSFSALEHCPEIDGFVVVAPRERLEQVQAMAQLYGCHKIRKIVPGGASYMVCLTNGLNYVDETVDTIVIHEASRPGVQAEDVGAVVKASRKTGCAALARSVEGRWVTAAANHVVDKPVDGSKLREVGTPLAVTREALDKALAKAKKNKKTFKHPMELMEYAGVQMRMSLTQKFPVKISEIKDLAEVEAILRLRQKF